MEQKRLKRLEEVLRQEIAALISRGEIKDPRVTPFVSVTRVEASRDGSHAKVWVSSLPGQEVSLEQSAEGLNHAAGFIQSQIAKNLHIRLTPVLHFIADKGIEEGFDMTEKLKDLERE
ncbi:MAG: 30S ribosome-binding factor RbfA [Spirochaetaceae bacterium]|nr:30S ribosome-binding factor RbfA [Spirochaetaceae bacterium]